MMSNSKHKSNKKITTAAKSTTGETMNITTTKLHKNLEKEIDLLSSIKSTSTETAELIPNDLSASTLVLSNKLVRNKPKHGINGAKEDKKNEETSITSSPSPIQSYLKSLSSQNKQNENPSYNANVRKVESAIRDACAIAIVSWMFLLLCTFVVVPRENFVPLNNLEKNCSWIAFLLIVLSFISRLIPLMYRKMPTVTKKKKQKFVSCHGVVLGALVVQSIAMITDLSMAILPTPVIVDPVTGVRVFMLRWVEWTPLAFLMTFMTEVVGMEDCTCLSCSPKNGEKKMCNWRNAWIIASLQGLSTVCGLIFPFCTDVNVWIAVMVFSFITFFAIFPRLYHRYDQYRESTCCRQHTNKKEEKIVRRGSDSSSSGVDDDENYNKRRLSFQLMLSCVITWTTLVLFYFVAWLGPIYSHPTSVLRAKETSMIIECFLDVLAKVFYLLVIVEIHMVLFDDDVRAARRLREMRQMMSAVWESSSDVIAISVKSGRIPIPSHTPHTDKSGGKVTTMLSPTYKRLFELDKNESNAIPAFKSRRKTHNRTNDEYEYDEGTESKVVVFDLDESDFHAFHHRNKSVSPKLSFVEHDEIDTTEEKQDKKLLDKSELISIGDLIVKAWSLEKRREHLLHHDVPRSDGVILNFEANITWITEDQNCLIIVMRDITERVMRFEAEKRIVSESTARAKDAEANRFTRHEVKNGLLTAIELCRTLRSAYDVQLESSIMPNGGNANVLLKCSDDDDEEDMIQQNIDIQEYFKDLKHTLNDILDTILSEAMARDVINEVYQPKLDKVDIRKVLCGTGTKSHVEYERFPFVSFPSPLPSFLFDAQLLRHIHQNAISNACKYGKVKGVVLTQVQYDSTNRILDMSVINLPGPNHDKLLAVNNTQANQTVFAQGTRFSIHDKYNTSQSSGDGAWIMSKCAKTLGGECSIKFEPKRTVFRFRCPATPYHESLQSITVDDVQNFHVPSDTWGIVIDDSKMQRKMLDRFLSIVGVYSNKRVILGNNETEILSFNDTVVDMIQKHTQSYFLLIVDENLNTSDDINSTCISGSTLVEEIRARLSEEDENRVLALVRSANDNMDDVSIYRRRAHDYLPKTSMQKKTVLELFVPIWMKRFPYKCDLSGKRQTSFGDTKTLSRSASVASCNNNGDAQPREAILQTVDVIDALVHEESLLSQRWAMVWNKLHLLKGDMMSISPDDEELCNRLRYATHGIEKLRGNIMPSDFIQRWREIRAFILSACENNNNSCNSSSCSGSSFKD